MRTHRHLDVNEAAVRHSGYSRDEMLGRTKPELGFGVAPDQRDRLLHQLVAAGQVRDFEVTFRTKSGDERQLLTNSEVITYEGEPAVLSVSVDITERKQLEAQQDARRQEAELLARTKDEFLATWTSRQSRCIRLTSARLDVPCAWTSSSTASRQYFAASAVSMRTRARSARLG